MTVSSLESALLDTIRSAVREELAPVLARLTLMRGEAETELVPLPEAAKRLGLSLRTIQRRAKSGVLRVEDVGGTTMARLPAGTPRA